MMETTTIGKAFKLKSGTNLSAKNMIDGEYPVFGGNGISGYHHEYIFEGSKIVIGRVGAYCGNVHKTTPKSWITDNALYIDKSFVQYDNDFLVLMLRNLNLNRFASQSGQPLISAGRLKDVKIPLPPLSQQKKIAAILDKADELRQKDKELIAKYDELTQSLFLDMFGDPFVNNKGFELTELQNIVDKVQIGPFGSQLHKSDYISNGIPLINPTHIDDRKIVEDLDFTIDQMKFSQLPNYHLKEDDVIMGRRGEMGRAALVNEKSDGWFCGTGSLFIRPSEKINPTFILHLITEEAGVHYLEHNAKGVTMKNLNKTIINQMRFGLPPLGLQNQFAERVQAIEKQKSVAQKSLEKSEELFNSLLQRAFKGRAVSF